ncbi:MULTISPECIES: GH32 C-terminal domain-containing protein [Bacillus]|nr:MULTISPECIES: GH32 C-terminal domain-containing protein [Bacillus]MBP1082807.1 fructan beta-fructosidase [Bacillus capparidis]MED1098450.1 GH32 C-terminal domain-containing protein [Bacillus capparidis]
MKIKTKMMVVFCFIILMLAACKGEEEKEVEKEKEFTLPIHEADSDYFTERFRQQYHYSPEAGNLADPNGMVYFQGEYHQFFQQNGQWAHAISKDLIHWDHQPIALFHDDLGQSLSGSAVVDWNDTTGFFEGKPGLVAMFTNAKEGVESQSIAYSKDGRTWEKYEGNPVIPNPGVKDFRDPKVFWHEESKKWVMVVSSNLSVRFYGSPDLKKWDFLSEFGGQGSQAGVWECPDLFQLPVDGDPAKKKWVLHVSIGDNEETAGSSAQYFVGEFDGVHFTNDNPKEEVLWTDYGRDFYAAQSYSDVPAEDGRRIWLGWMSNWRYPYQSPTEPWKGTLSIPRALSLKTEEDGKVRLVQQPVEELKNLRAGEKNFTDLKVDGSLPISDFSGTTFEFEGVAEWEALEEFGIRLRKSEKEETAIGYQSEGSSLFVDRTKSGLPSIIDRTGAPFEFGKRFTSPYPPEKKQVKIHGFVDESSVELFINDGEQVFSNLIYTNPANRNIELYSNGGPVTFKSLNFYHLKSTWRKSPKTDQAERVVVNDKTIDLKVGESKETQAILKPDFLKEKKDIVWKSESDVVEVTQTKDGKAVIKGLKPGQAEITAADSTGKITSQVTVFVVE